MNVVAKPSIDSNVIPPRRFIENKTKTHTTKITKLFTRLLFVITFDFFINLFLFKKYLTTKYPSAKTQIIGTNKYNQFQAGSKFLKQRNIMSVSKAQSREIAPNENILSLFILM